MTQKTTTLIMASAVTAGLVFLTGCDRKSTVETTGEKAERAAERAAATTERAAERAAKTANEAVPSSTKLKWKGNWNQVKGRLKQNFAELTDDDLLYVEGKEEELRGRLQKRLGKTRAEIDSLLDQ
jgi:uncharacterized protein YjbJ (UPF0337 family)